MILSLGEQLGPYEILEHIGSGGMSEVYRGRDSRLDRVVAIKVLYSSGNDHADHTKRVLLEARAASALNHPNIVTVYDVGRHQERDFLVMEYLPGPSLEELLKKGPLGVSDAVRYALQVASGLERAHAVGILHRDLKPANIMLSGDGSAKLVDFGIAKLNSSSAQSDSSSSVTQDASDSGHGTATQGFKGSPAYMSPEQAQRLPIDVRSEVFSFGAVLYELVTGIRAFPGSVLTALKAVVSVTPRAPRVINPRIPPELETLILSCLNKDPAHRPSSMEVVRARLRSILGISEDPTPARFGSRVHASVWVTVSGASLAVVAGIIWFLNIASSEPTLAPLLTLPVTTDVSVEIQGSLSPDGRQIAFVSNAANEKNMDVYVKAVDSTAPPLRLTNHDGRDVSPSWTPDGRWILFIRRDQLGGGTVMRVAALGGAETIVSSSCNAPDQFFSWSPDGAWFTCHGDAKEAGIYQVWTATGEVNRLTTPPDGLVDTQAAVSPNGERLIFLRGPASGLVVRDLFELPLDALGVPQASPKLIVKPPLPPFRYLTWTPDGREAVIALAQPDGLATKLYRFEVKDSAAFVGPLKTGAASAFEPTMGRNSRRLVFTEQGLQLDLWRSYDSGAQQHTLTSTRLEFHPEYSPDGARVAFVSDRSGRDELWVALEDGTLPVQLTDMGSVGTPRWSPDGRVIAFVFSDSRTAQTDIYAINSDGGTPRKATDGIGANSYPAFSRDGNWLYFTSDRTGRDEIHRISLENNVLEQVTHNGGLNSVPSVDGWRVIFQKRGATAGSSPQRELWEMSADGQGERALGLVVAYGTFALVREGILHVPMSEYGKQASLLKLYNFETGKTTDVRAITGPVIDLTARSTDAVLYTLSSTRFDLVRVDDFR